MSTENRGQPYCQIAVVTEDKVGIDTTAFAQRGDNMKRLISVLVAAAFVASPAAAATKQKKDKQTTEAEDIAKQHDNTRRALRDALPLVLPSWSLPFYFGMNLDQTKDQKKKY
jgi:hypothetical protein